jgi:hypothetical protein
MVPLEVQVEMCQFRVLFCRASRADHWAQYLATRFRTLVYAVDERGSRRQAFYPRRKGDLV